MKSIIKKGIVILLGVGAVAIGYKLFFSSPSAPKENLTSSAPVTNTTAPTITDTAVGRELLSTLLNLRTIKLNDQIFTNPSFTSLRDFTITLSGNTPEGRPNPFAPIGTDAAPAPAAGGVDAVQQNVPTVTTAPATNITKNTVLLNALVANNTNSFSGWFEWSKVGTTPATVTTPVSFAGSNTSFSTPVIALLPNTNYTVKAFVKIGEITLTGASVAFKTPAQ